MKSSFLGLCLLSLICLSSGKMKELTHLLKNDEMARYPSHTPFKSTLVFAGAFSDAVPWVAVNEITLGEHIGTHVDAPYHFHKEGKFLHQIPLERWEGPAVVINIEERAKSDPQAMVMPEDLEAWEEKHGQIPYGAWIIMASGWSKYWPDQMTYVGTNDSTIPTYRFPGFSPESAHWILENGRGISGLASDTISCDNGNYTGTTLPVHVILQPKDILCVEMVKDAEQIPEAGATFHAWPIHIFEGTGAPLRAYATWDEDDERRGGERPPPPPPPQTCTASNIGGIFGLVVLMAFASIIY